MSYTELPVSPSEFPIISRAVIDGREHVCKATTTAEKYKAAQQRLETATNVTIGSTPKDRLAWAYSTETVPENAKFIAWIMQRNGYDRETARRWAVELNDARRAHTSTFTCG
jgi:hypothetical protein